MEALEALAPLDREILVHRVIEGLPSGVVAERLALTPSAVRMRCRRAMERLRKSLPRSIFQDLEP